jgi:hypothetical protein
MRTSTRIECQVCFEYRRRSSFTKTTANCNHKLNICESCVKKHIKSQLNSKVDVEINCPFDECNQKFDSDDIKNIDDELFERFEALTLRQTLSIIPEFRWCKNPECDSGQIHLEGGNTRKEFSSFLLGKMIYIILMLYR